MPVYRLTRRLVFPPVEHAEDGLLAVGGDLSPERLLLAYRSGIFPWYDEDQPILWHSPDPRCVFVLAHTLPNRSLRKVMAKGLFEVRYDEAFVEVIRACKEARRRSAAGGDAGTWITDEMEEAYVRLHQLGYAHSVETYAAGELVGGLYGVSIGHMFFGESMFTRRSDASKVALMTLAARLRARGWAIIDSQVANPLTLSLGAEEWPRVRYLATLAHEVALPGEVGMWSSDERREAAEDESPQGRG